MVDLLSWQYAVTGIAIYLSGICLYRLILHPLARFPGPFWTAITRYYEGYYDVIRNGQYTFKIAELHKIYGPIVRISPYEVHINDPAFYKVLYCQDAHYDKDPWKYDAFSARGATLFTPSHHLHRARRQPLAPYFAKAKVLNRLDLIYRHTDKLHQRLSEFVQNGVVFDFGAAMTAVAKDVANEYILGKSYNSLDKEDFDAAMNVASRGSGQIWHLTKFVRWFGPTLLAMPMSWMSKLASSEMKVFFRFMEEVQNHTKYLISIANSPNADQEIRRTAIHEIIDSKLPPSEKVYSRVVDDALTLTGAGYETTAGALRLLVFNVFSKPSILRRLRDELEVAGGMRAHRLDLKTLEQLPYLTAVLHEGLRLSPGSATRSTRIVPESGLSYNKWQLPAGTVVGMTMLLLCQNESLYPQAERFDPDRWLDGDRIGKIDSSFAPFAKGTRNCLGMHLAWAEMYILLADVVQRYDLAFQDAVEEDFRCISDQFALATNARGVLKASIAEHKALT